MMLIARVYSLNIENSESTINYIINNKCSVSRFGDGEFGIMSNLAKSIGFQIYSEELRIRLWDVINSSDLENHIICLPYSLYHCKNMKQKPRQFWKNYLPFFTFRILPKIKNRNRVFYDTLCTRLYMDYLDSSNVNHLYNSWKRVWDNRDILLVEGVASKIGIGNDLLDNAKSVKRILIPSTNAFSVYPQILNSVLSHSNFDQLVLIAAGPTATILAYDLARFGVQAIDVGHIDVEYCWYKMGATKVVPIPGKYVNEAGGLCDGKIHYDYMKDVVELIE